MPFISSKNELKIVNTAIKNMRFVWSLGFMPIQKQSGFWYRFLLKTRVLFKK
jgi:hypothetical protein